MILFDVKQENEREYLCHPRTPHTHIARNLHVYKMFEVL